MAGKKRNPAMATNPLGKDDLLAETFFRKGDEKEETVKKSPGKTTKPAPATSSKTKTAKTKPKPDHYKVCCISLYTEDIERLEALVAELKRRGHTKANKSQLIRFALATVDLDDMPKTY